MCLWSFENVFVSRLRAIMFVSFVNNWLLRFKLPRLALMLENEEKGKSASGMKMCRGERRKKVMRDFSFDEGASNNNV